MLPSGVEKEELWESCM